MIVVLENRQKYSKWLWFHFVRTTEKKNVLTWLAKREDVSTRSANGCHCR